MQITEAIIERFLANRCTAAEALFISGYLDEHPETLEAHLKQSWKEAEGNDTLPEGYYKEMLDAIRAGAFIKQPARIRRLAGWISVAALLLLMAGAGWMLWGGTKEASPDARPVAGNAAEAPGKWIVKRNTGNKDLNIGLQDGSVITLSARASVKYQEPFVQDRRDIYLEGEAFFEVTKDKTRPFTVYTGLFSTTALGTSFLVTEQEHSYRVRLHTGKVVIRALDQGLPGWEKDVFLWPGQQMQYEAVKQLLTVTKQENDQPAGTGHRATGQEEKSAGELVFEHAPLREVLKKLSVKYKEPVLFDPAETTGMYFSGVVLKSDSLPVILDVIAQMNGLSITRQANGFVVKKSQ